MEELGTLLGIWAHPDDDIYLSSGLMAAAAAAGERVVDVTATRGEGGSLDEDRWPSERMGEVRTQELYRSLEILGVKEHRFLQGCRDVDMQTGLDEVGAPQVLDIVGEIQPHTVLTFGPEGMTGHAGHKSVHRWATAAFRTAAPSGARLFYATNSPAWVQEWVPKLQEFDMFLPGTPPMTPDDEIDLHLVLDDDLRELKLRAISAHESQVGGLLEVFGGEGFKRAFAQESYRLEEVKP
jgi:LmbE family N-acetylglucosaminyl deacetylase